jgi:hypothetical protein
VAMIVIFVVPAIVIGVMMVREVMKERKRRRKAENLYYDTIRRAYLNADGKELGHGKTIEETDNGLGRSEGTGKDGQEGN